jgi:hypothetical protein
MGDFSIFKWIKYKGEYTLWYDNRTKFKPLNKIKPICNTCQGIPICGTDDRTKCKIIKKVINRLNELKEIYNNLRYDEYFDDIITPLEKGDIDLAQRKVFNYNNYKLYKVHIKQLFE